MNKIIFTERKQLSPEFTVVWYWFDLKHQNPYYIAGTDPNIPESGLYQCGKLVSTVNWHPSVTVSDVLGFLSTANGFQRIPCNARRIPESI